MKVTCILKFSNEVSLRRKWLVNPLNQEHVPGFANSLKDQVLHPHQSRFSPLAMWVKGDFAGRPSQVCMEHPEDNPTSPHHSTQYLQSTRSANFSYHGHPAVELWHNWSNPVGLARLWRGHKRQIKLARSGSFWQTCIPIFKMAGTNGAWKTYLASRIPTHVDSRPELTNNSALLTKPPISIFHPFPNSRSGQVWGFWFTSNSCITNSWPAKIQKRWCLRG